MKKDMNEAGKHIPIMLTQCIEGLEIKEGDIVVDCTVNRGGHAKEFAKKLSKNEVLICIDLDSDALKEAEANINLELNDNESKPKIFYVNNNFSNLEIILKELGIEKVDKIFADFGLSSQELDVSGRGFSFMRDEPLLMTFKTEANINSDEDTTARDIVNYWGEESIANILFNFADERYSRRIAKGIIDARKIKTINTTFELVEIIKSSTPFAYHKLKTNPATRTFQALRMAVNDEIGAIVSLLNSSLKVLTENGRLAVLTFHSTEDRIVKHTARDIGFKQINKKAIIAEREEVKENVRSRSAKLRIYEKKN
jgi:16S rRNA (cytosine1402-N4)-methyltransferase